MKFTVPNPSIEIELQDEKAVGSVPAILEVSVDGNTLFAVQAVIGREEDPERGWLNVVKFRRIK